MKQKTLLVTSALLVSLAFAAGAQDRPGPLQIPGVPWGQVERAIGGAIPAIVAPSPSTRASQPAPADAFMVYISPSGDDGRTGATPRDAVRTLDRVQQILRSHRFGAGEKQTVVKFLPGTYRGLEVTWDYFSPGRPIVFEPLDYQPGRYSVVIDGAGTDAQQFFLLRLTEPSPQPVQTAITIRGFHITNFCEGVSLGDWKSKATVTGNTIEDNMFTRIGSKYQTPTRQADGRTLPGGSCVAALRLKQATGNVVRRNVFRQIENIPAKRTATAKYGPTLLHAMYISNRSSGNLIESNRFEQFSGSPIRIRSSSDDNKIVRNVFADPAYSDRTRPGYRIKAISQWYCNSAVQECLRRAEEGNVECPSTGIEISDNQVSGNVELYADESQSPNPTCSDPGRRASAIVPRLERNSVGR